MSRIIYILLGGKLDRHFLIEACPIYHNLIRKECKDNRQEINKKSAVRKKALAAIANKSPQQSPTSEHKRYAQKVRKIISINIYHYTGLF